MASTSKAKETSLFGDESTDDSTELIYLLAISSSVYSSFGGLFDLLVMLPHSSSIKQATSSS